MTTEIAFTEEAQKLLAEEARLLREELEQEAVAEARRSRGRPIEVTASDVRRARIRFVKRDRTILPMTDLILRVYMIAGALVFVGGFLYPLLRPLLAQQDPIARTSLMISLGGLAMAAAGFFGRFYVRWVDDRRARRRYEEYEQERRDAKLP
jgi:hypothetical protein